MEKITDELIKGGMSGSGGWNKKQVELLGLKWPLTNGWKHRIIGTSITRENALKFLKLKGETIKPRRQIQSDLVFPSDCPKCAARTVDSFWLWLDRQPISTRRAVNDSLAYILRKNNQAITPP